MALTVVGPINGLTLGQAGGVNAVYDITAAAVLVGVAPQTVTAITQATQAVATVSTVSSANPFQVGEAVVFASVSGMTQINGVTGTVLALGGSSGAWTVTTSINSSAYSAYTSGGTASSPNPSVLCALVCQVAGSITLNDSYSTTGAAVTNQIIAVAMTAGQVLVLNWPCASGITASVVSTGTFALTFS